MFCHSIVTCPSLIIPEAGIIIRYVTINKLLLFSIIIITVERMVELGYPKQLADTEYVPDFAVRGLIFDKKLGNFLKLDLHGLVLTACRGEWSCFLHIYNIN